jgi:hypothetical protein
LFQAVNPDIRGYRSVIIPYPILYDTYMGIYGAYLGYVWTMYDMNLDILLLVGPSKNSEVLAMIALLDRINCFKVGFIIITRS